MSSSSSTNTTTTTTIKNGGVLTSLPLYDEWRNNPQTTWHRMEGSNLDVLIDDTTKPQQQQQQQGLPRAMFQFLAVLPFTLSQGTAIRSQHEVAAAVALAAHHLNVGDGHITPEIQDLPNWCPIGFTVDYADTEITASIAIDAVLEAMNREERLPSAFVGTALSSISIPTSMLTGIKGYPQVSAGSTSADLDDQTQSPLFARTIPSDDGTAIPIVRFLAEEWNVEYLAVVHINDAYGNAFVQSLRNAASKYAPKLQLFAVSLDDTPSAIQAACQTILDIDYQYVFATVFEESTHDLLMETAYELGIAGTGRHTWLFGDSFPSFANRQFEINSPLHLAYRGAGILEATGGVSGLGLEGYEEFLKVVSQLNNPSDLATLNTLFPHEKYGHTLDQLENFMSPSTGAYTAFAYEAAIALGLAACRAVTTTTSDSSQLLYYLNGKEHYKTMVNSTFGGVNGQVAFDPATGNIDPTQSLFKLLNLREEIIVNGDNSEFVQFQEDTSHLFQNTTWQELQPFVFNDGSNQIPSDIPFVDLENTILAPVIRYVVWSLCGIVLLLAVGCMIWTHRHRRSRVVLASQPFFLYIVCTGTLFMGATLVPLTFDHGLVAVSGATIACNASIWLIVMGFSITICALFTKTYRVNKIALSAARMKRIKVTIWQVVQPMLVLQSLNATILMFMSIFGPSLYEITVDRVDSFGQATEIRGQCTFYDAYPYLIAVSVVCFGTLAGAVREAWKARNLSTEFAESQSIFRAVLAMVLVLFVGGPVLGIAPDNPNVFVFVASAITFVTCCSILLLIFIPKWQYLSLSKSKRFAMRLSVSGVMNTNNNSRFESSRYEPEDYTGVKILTTKTPEELVREVEELQRLLARVQDQPSSEAFTPSTAPPRQLVSDTLSGDTLTSIQEELKDSDRSPNDPTQDSSVDSGEVGLEDCEVPVVFEPTAAATATTVGDVETPATTSKLDSLRQRRDMAEEKYHSHMLKESARMT